MKEIQQTIETILNQAVEKGQELGIQVAAYHRGELVVDAWAGIADRCTGRAVDGATLFPVFSATKGVAATVIHILAEQGKLDYDMRIGEIWPEFGVNGKERATIRHALNHTAGIPQHPAETELEALADWDGMCSKIAELVPVSPPGERMEYHAVTFGWIIGEIAQRVDGRSFSRIMEEEICRPLGIRDMYIGLPEELEPRVAELEEPEARPPGDERQLLSMPAWVWPPHAIMNRPEARRVCLPSGTGIMSAKALARHYAALLPGGVEGVQLLSPARVKIATEPLRLGGASPLPMGMGYQLGGSGTVMEPRLSVFGHEGYGGSIGFADPENRLAVGLTHNLFSPRKAASSILDAIKRELLQ
ncbi:MAG: class beta-lactamase-related serine hydrolase [Paenibacillaceae bacterium]|jgi:CubicO group peptidase (beta-lactamase class C family)|nr:class beta-lactamase-related serine hydrolase [Paenibacillaceae bacterium]